MTLDEIKELARHREVSPWVVKLVQDAVELEREKAAKVCEEKYQSCRFDDYRDACQDIAAAIRSMK